MIEYIHIKGFKSLENIYLNSTDHIQTFIGKNGSGKTIFFKAVKYFFDNLIEDNYSLDNYDQNNPYNYELEIKIRFNLEELTSPSRRVPNNKYYEKIKKTLNLLNEESSITLVLSQNRRKKIKWNLPYEYRYLIHNSHPFYYISTHEADFQKWDLIWDTIGTLGNVFDFEKSTDFKKVFIGRSAKDFQTNIDYLKKIFQESGYSLQKETNQSQLTMLYQLALRGSQANQNGFDLNYYSSGTNSLNYLKLLVTLVNRLVKEKIKSPIIIIDEPELGLHTQYLDEFKELVFSVKDIQFFVSTHSARYLAETMRHGKSVHKFYLLNEYSNLISLPKLNDSRSKIIFSENEASLYFASFILFVEGPSELEVFKNPCIQKLFPFIKKIGISPTLANSVLLETLNPNKTKLPIPYLLVADIDKALGNKNQDAEKHFFKVSIKNKEEYSPANKNFKKDLSLNFSEDRWIFDIINKRMLNYENEEFEINIETGLIKDTVVNQYYKMIQDLRDYYKIFKVHLLFPTLEGALINKNTLYDFIRIFEINIRLDNISERELLFKLRQYVGGNSEDLKNRKSLIEGNNDFSKTSGWITKFIEGVFEEIENEKSIESKKNKFKEKFPDIYGIINKIEKMT